MNTVVVRRLPACKIEMDVKVQPEAVRTARKTAIKKVGKEVTFPGFRRGKAPEEVVLKRHPGAVEGEWHKAIADVAFASAQQQERIPVLNTGAPVNFDLKKHSLEEGAEVTFTFETEPHIPFVDPKKFVRQPVDRAVVGDKELDEAIRQIRFFYAKWTSIKDRGVQEGDYIMIDLDTMDGDVTTKVFNNVRFEVSKQRMALWMQHLVMGKMAGELLEGMSQPDDTASEEEKREFTPKKVLLKIHHIEAAELPEVADEFAKKIGAETVPLMRESIRGILEKTAEEKAREQLGNQVNDFLIAEYQFELPLTLITTERDHRKSQLLNDPKTRSSYDDLSPEEQKKADERIFEEANQAVRLFYLSRQIVRQAQIPVKESEVQQEAVKTASAYGQKVDPAHLPKEVFALALSKVILAKAQDYILQEGSSPETPKSI
jgi:trigger factor